MIAMTHTANTNGINAKVAVPFVTENGALFACLLPMDGLDMANTFPLIEAMFRQYLGSMQAIPSFDNAHAGNSRYESVPGYSDSNTDFLSWTGRLLHSIKKQRKMATEQQKGVASDRIFTDAAYERTRENMAEFGRSGKAASLLREIFRDMTVYAKDQDLQSRLLKVFSRVLSTDAVNKRGERTVGNGDHLHLKGFNFNSRAGVRETLYARCPVALDRVAGTATVTIPSFVPKMMVQAPKGTTHYRIVAGSAAVNFDTELYSYMRGATAELSWDQLPTVASSIALNFPANTPDTILVALGIEFVQKVNGQSYPLKTTSSNATTIVAVDKPV